MAPYALAKFSEIDTQGFQEAIQPHVYQFLERAQLGQRVTDAIYALRNNNPQAVYQLLSNIDGWLKAHGELAAGSGPHSPTVQEERLTARENSLKEQENRIFIGEIGRETLGYQGEQVDKALTPYMKGTKLSDSAKERLKNAIAIDIYKTLNRDKGYQRQIKTFLANRDARGTTQYVKGQLATIIPQIVRKAYQDLYGVPPKAVKTASSAPVNGQRALLGGEIRVAKKPAISDIEKRAGYMTSFIAGKAIMAKGPLKGRVVRWR